MLTISCLRSSSCHYYLAEYLEPGKEAFLPSSAIARPPLSADNRLVPDTGQGFWTGTSSAALGLGGGVRAQQLERLLQGCHPGSGRTMRSQKRVSVSGYDLCFSSPKSVSILYGAGEERWASEIASAHLVAMDRALDYVERHAMGARRSEDGERTVIATDGVLGAAFTHSGTRTGDPHLHTHVVIPNLVHGSDGRWSVADGRGVFVHAPAAGALYEAHLRWELSHRMGVDWVRRPRGQLEVNGVTPAALGEFSRRRAEIAEHLWRRSATSWRANRVAWATTRDAKGGYLPIDVLRARWQQRAQDVGLEVKQSLLTTKQRLEARSARASDLDGMDERHIAAMLSGRDEIYRRDVVMAWSGAAKDGAPADEVDACVEFWLHDDRRGVTEARFAPSVVVAPSHLVQLIGPRPVRAAHQAPWRDAAEAIENYCRRWARPGLCSELTTTELPLRGMEASRMAHLLTTRRAMGESMRMIGRRPGAEREAPERGRAL